MEKNDNDPSNSNNEGQSNPQNNPEAQNNLSQQTKVVSSGIRQRRVPASWEGRLMPSILRGSTAHNQKIREQLAKESEQQTKASAPVSSAVTLREPSALSRAQRLPISSGTTLRGPDVLSTEQLIAAARRYLLSRTKALSTTSSSNAKLPSKPTQKVVPEISKNVSILTGYETLSERSLQKKYPTSPTATEASTTLKEEALNQNPSSMTNAPATKRLR
ncbi:hypothetical protein [Candidatus Berkiella aquae]|uniref:Uncharacterized protein n=1 Tax=Candidatus Berkiella aquae TaxID=295108 RepID=A0A0Q9YPH2_9GAMM|nr:hypothetical protein [Candidatus Berkiella aquae]MCS5709936.1 hypothetical protein [Candidatus Berkiella aquae]